MARRKSRRRRPFQEDEYLDIETEFPDRGSGWSDRFSGVGGHFIDILKLVCGICLISVLYAVCVSFAAELARLDHSMRVDFWVGVIAFLLLSLFLWEPEGLYARGQKVLGASFSFFKPLARIIAAVIPFYTLLIFIVYALCSLGVQSVWLQRYLLFLSGFTVCMHMVFLSRQERSRKYDFLKSHYVFICVCAFTISIVLLAGLFSLAFNEFSFADFINRSGQEVRQAVRAVWRF